MDTVICLIVLFVVIQAEIQNKSEDSNHNGVEWSTNGDTDATCNEELVDNGVSSSTNPNVDSNRSLDKDKHQSSTRSQSTPHSNTSALPNTWNYYSEAELSAATRNQGLVSNRTASNSTMLVNKPFEASNRRTGKSSAPKMLAPFYKVGYKMGSGVIGSANGVKEIGSGTYKVADGAFDLVKMGFQRITNAFLLN